MHDLAYVDAIGQAELVASKEVSPLELVDAAIARIEALNPALNAVITPMFEHARARAAAPLPEGPFRGVPMLLKDVLARYEGVRLTFGSRYTSEFVPKHHSELVLRYLRAGFTVVGKSSTPEFGILPTTEPHAFGPTRNPWDLTRSAGGSSGGSAAAVASGMVPMAHASDGGGSIRIPACCCGLVGLKPTRARTPLGPDVGEVMMGFVVEHALTRTVRDSAAVLDVTHGPDLGAPYVAPPPARAFAEEVGADPGSLRVALMTEAPSGVPVHPDCVTAAAALAKKCEALGHHVEIAAPKIDGAEVSRAFLAIWAAGVTATVAGLEKMLRRSAAPGELEPLTVALAELGGEISAAHYMLAGEYLRGVSRTIATWMQDFDVWLTPTLGEPAAPLGTFEAEPDNPLAGFFRAASYVPFTPLQNVTGQPAMSVPVETDADGFPIGVQLIARFGDEATLFRLASQLEAAHPWADRRPPVG